MKRLNFVPPSGLLDILNNEEVSSFSRNYKNTPLKVGVVVKVHEVDDEKNISKLFPEYDVVTSEQNGEKGQGFVEYTNCICADSFGGIADYMEKKLRNPQENFRESYKFDKQDANLVLILCLDGFSDKPIIIGGLSNPSRKTGLTKEKGLHLEGEYNGLNWQVNKEGELTVTFKSKTNNKGEPQDEKAGGSFFKINNKGGFELNDNDTNSIVVDKENKEILTTSGGNIKNTAEGNFEVTATKDFNVKANNLLLDISQGSATLNAKSLAFKMSEEAALEAKKINVKVQNSMKVDAKELDLKANTINVNGSSVFLGGPGGQPSLTLTTQFIGLGNLGAPVASIAVGPFSSKVFVSL